MKCGKKMAKGGIARPAPSKAKPMKGMAMKSGGVVMRGKGAATKGFKANGPMA